MRRFKDIIEDIKAPSVQDLWLNGGKLKYYGEKGWQDIKGQGDFPTLATVATSGSYNDLSDKPDIPPAYTLPKATTTERGGVLMARIVEDLDGTEDTAAICTRVNALLAALRSSGVLRKKY